MKKLVCMALSAALLAGSVPAYAADYITKVPHTFTAKVGTTEFTKDGAAQPLDVAIYTKNGYTMLPLRTFMQALDADATLAWSNGTKLAEVTLHDFTLTFDINGNRIWAKSSQLPVFGQLEVKDGRVFVPLRDWEGVLKCFNRYIVDADALSWDAETKTAAVQLTELTAATANDTSSVKGTGEAAVFGIPLTIHLILNGKNAMMISNLSAAIISSRKNTSIPRGIFWVGRRNMKISRQIGFF